MSLEQFKITESEKQNNGVISAPDTLTGTAQENKSIFDKLIGIVANKYNNALTFIDNVINTINQNIENRYTKEETDAKLNLKANSTDVYKKNETYSQQEINGKVAVKANSVDVYKKTETYTKQEVNSAIDKAVFETGSSDMAKAVYDKDNNGIVDNSQRLGGQLPEYYAKENNSWSLSGGIEIERNTDLNNITEVGNYYCLSTAKNSPTDTQFTMKVIDSMGKSGATKLILQIIITQRSTEEWKRRLSMSSSGEWTVGNWVKITVSTDFDPVKTLAQNAMPKNGGTFTSSVLASGALRKSTNAGELRNVRVTDNLGAEVSTSILVFERE